MGREALLPHELDRMVAGLLAEKIREQGISRRSMEAHSGVKRGRLGHIFHDGYPLTVGEVFLLARALGTTASAVVREAEGRVGGRVVGLGRPPFAPTEEVEPEENAAMKGKPGEGPSAYDEQ